MTRVVRAVRLSPSSSKSNRYSRWLDCHNHGMGFTLAMTVPRVGSAAFFKCWVPLLISASGHMAGHWSYVVRAALEGRFTISTASKTATQPQQKRSFQTFVNHVASHIVPSRTARDVQSWHASEKLRECMRYASNDLLSASTGLPFGARATSLGRTIHRSMSLLAQTSNAGGLGSELKALPPSQFVLSVLRPPTPLGS
jgi:hypothetical protein